MTVVPLVEGSVATQIDIGLPDDQIFQRYLVRRIFRECEFVIKETDGETVTGFITGFDERCIQVSTSPANAADEPHSVLLFWPVRKITETGRRVEDLDSDSRSKIRSYSHALRSQCEAFLTGSKTQRRRPEPVENPYDASDRMFSAVQ